VEKINGCSIFDKCRYEIQEQKEVTVWYTGIYRSILSTTLNLKIDLVSSILKIFPVGLISI
jgi:hypothetical protein